ncbi:hypothetical protein [Thiocystis violacea]|uniref:hypothetical protein n=1 Tax=Thiocystis violacea TaxID=13725 RepID=UPI00190801FF|nr:hypothetical protein [Thiocystis violacea]
MKRALYAQTDRHLRPWVAEVARALIHDGTVARRLLEADLDGWIEPLASNRLDVLHGASRLEARIRSLFTGFTGSALTHAGLNGSLLARGRHWR